MEVRMAEVSDGDGARAVLVEDAESVAEGPVEVLKGLGLQVSARELEKAPGVEERRALLLPVAFGRKFHSKIDLLKTAAHRAFAGIC